MNRTYTLSRYAQVLLAALLFAAAGAESATTVAPTRTLPAAPGATTHETSKPAVPTTAPVGSHKVDIGALQQSGKFNFPRRVPDDDDRRWNQYRELKDAWWRQRDVVVRKMLQECPARSFSAADRSKAGCLPNDRVQDCDVKLVRYCAAQDLQIWRQIGADLKSKASPLDRQIQNTIRTLDAQRYSPTASSPFPRAGGLSGPERLGVLVGLIRVLIQHLAQHARFGCRRLRRLLELFRGIARDPAGLVAAG